MKAAIILWDARSRTKKSMVPLGEVWLKCVAFSPTGQILAAGGSSVHLFDVVVRKEAAELVSLTPLVIINSIAFSPDGMLLVAGGQTGTLALWEVATGRQIR